MANEQNKNIQLPDPNLKLLPPFDPMKTVKHPGGRPSKYNPNFADQLIEFFDIEPFIERTIEIEYSESGKIKREIKKMVPNKLPQLSAFARKIGVTMETMELWTRAVNEDGSLKHPEFTYAYEYAKSKQKEILIENGLQGLYNATAFIFTSKNVTDMRDRQELDVAGALNLGVAAIAKVVQDQTTRKEVSDGDFTEFETISPGDTTQPSSGDS